MRFIIYLESKGLLAIADVCEKKRNDNDKKNPNPTLNLLKKIGFPTIKRIRLLL